MKLTTVPSRFVAGLFVPAFVALIASTTPASAIPDLDPPPWLPLPFLYSKGHQNPSPQELYGHVIAVDFAPWDTVKAWDGDSYGFVNDGAAPGGLVFGLAANATLAPSGTYVTAAPGKPRLVYSFPNPHGLPTHRLTGSNPFGAMATGQDGNIYGRTVFGGAFGNGVLFKVDRTGRYQTLHHLEKHGQPAGLIVAQNGDVYSATTADSSAEVSWVFRLSKDGSYKNIPVANGLQMQALVETVNHDILLATVTSAGPAGALWRLNGNDEFEQIATLTDAPSKLLALPNGHVLCLTRGSILEVTPAGATSVAHQFVSATEGTEPKFLEIYGTFGFIGSTSTGGGNRGGTYFFMKPDYTGFRVNWDLTRAQPGQLNGPFTTWMDRVFPARAVADADNRAPIAKDDVVSVTALKSQTPLAPKQAVVRVLDNDADADKDALTITSVGTPAHGFATVDPTSRVITYTATESPAQNDSFTYAIADGQGGTATAYVIVRANPAGRYTGQVVTDDPAGTAAGSLALNVGADRTVNGRLQMDGRTYAFTGRANDANQVAAVFANTVSINSLGIQLTLQPNGAGYAISADIQKNGVPLVAACAKQ